MDNLKNQDLYGLNLGINCSFLLEYPDGYLMIDTSYPEKYRKLKEELKKIGVNLSQIKHVLLTHSHIDHVGFAARLREQTHANIIVHENALPYLSRGQRKNFESPANLKSKIFEKVAVNLYHWGNDFPPLIINEHDTVISRDDDKTLRDIGIPGKILCTPGHTQDSISVVLDDGRAFVGDLTMDTLKSNDHKPLLIDNMGDLKDSWEKIVDEGAKIIYPAHGSSFDVGTLVSSLQRL